jgi:thiamine biosynthesis lipoprotein
VTRLGTAPPLEHRESFACFGSTCTVIVADRIRPGAAAGAVASAKRALLGWHEEFSRFRSDSELSRLNSNPRATVPVSPMMARILETALVAAARTDGLVDPTLVAEIEESGYVGHLEGPGAELKLLLELAPPRVPAGPRPKPAWRAINLDRRGGTVTRPPGVKLDPGGIAKGVFADELASVLSGYEAFVVDCGGDLRLGGTASTRRRVDVAGAFDDSVVHTLELSGGGVATSGISRRSWINPGGRPAHHLLDPATGEPAFTGVVQATALAPTAAEAESLSKAAVLAGAEQALSWLAHGGVLVLDDGSVQTVDSSAQGTTTASSCGESRATTYSAGSVSDRFSRMWVSRGGTYTRSRGSSVSSCSR